MKWCSVFPARYLRAPDQNGYRYRHIYEPGNEYPIYQRQSVLSAEWDAWDILLDANQRAAHSEFYTLGGMSISPDNAVMALAEDYLSRRQYGLRFRNLDTGNWYPEMLENVSPDFVWANDSETVYYVKSTPLRCCPIRYGGIPSERTPQTTSWFTKRKTKRFMSACIKPLRATM